MRPKKIRIALEGAGRNNSFKLTFEVGGSTGDILIKELVLQALQELGELVDQGKLLMEAREIGALAGLLETRVWGGKPHRTFEVMIGDGFDVEEIVEKLGSALTKIEKI